MCFRVVECLNIPKALFENDNYRDLSNGAKLLYSLFLERLKYAGVNGWVDQNGYYFIFYPKSEIMQDLKCSRYGADKALHELQAKKMIYVTNPCNGKANHIYVADITKDEEENEEVMKKMVKDILDKFEQKIMEALDELEAEESNLEVDQDDEIDAPDSDLSDEEKEFFRYVPTNLMEFKFLKTMFENGYVDEEGYMDVETVEADADDLGIDFALSMVPLFSKPYRIEMMDCLKELVASEEYDRLDGALAILALVLDIEPEWIGIMKSCDGIVKEVFLRGVVESMADIVRIYNEKEN